MPRATDPRWVVLVESGEYSTLGRHRAPEPDDIDAAESSLERAGHAGWLALMSNSVHDRTAPEFIMVRPLRQPVILFEQAVEAFRQRYG